MIASVRGEVVVRRPDHVVVESGGVGYRLAVSAESLKAVPAIGGEVALHSHLIMRDDGLALYGFSSETERDLFCSLISVSGVGPKVAMAILSGAAPRELVRMIAAGDAKRFQTVPGVGRKTAERIIVELREKVGIAADDPAVAHASDAEPMHLAREGLVGLGYSLSEAQDLLDSAEGESTEELISSALRAASRAA